MKTYKYGAYASQRKAAENRGIDWQFTYEEWVNWWGDDFDKRGKSSESLVMARKGDVGPYHPDNVDKKTAAENLAEGNNFMNGRYWETRGQSRALKIKTPYGIFNTKKEFSEKTGISRYKLENNIPYEVIK